MDTIRASYAWLTDPCRPGVVFSTRLAYGLFVRHAVLGVEWINEVMPDVLLGGLACSDWRHAEELHGTGVTAVLSLVEPAENTPTWAAIPVKPEEWDALGIKYRCLATPDHAPPSPPSLRAACEFIRTVLDEGGRVYVHCTAGRGRSASVVAAYMVASGHAETVAAAVEMLQHSRPIVYLNEPQLASVQDFVASLDGQRLAAQWSPAAQAPEMTDDSADSGGSVVGCHMPRVTPTRCAQKT